MGLRREVGNVPSERRPTLPPQLYVASGGSKKCHWHRQDAGKAGTAAMTHEPGDLPRRDNVPQTGVPLADGRE